MDLSPIDDKTSISLLDAVGSCSDQISWHRFIAVYEPMLHRWLRIRGFPEHLVLDVIGDVYLKLVHHMPSFVYNRHRSFRGWLRTVVENAAADSEKRAFRRYETLVDFQSATVENTHSQRLHQQDDRDLDEFVDEIDDRMRIASAVVKRVKKRVGRKTWQAFYLTEVEGNSCEDVALKLRMKPGSVYVYRFRVKNFLRAEAEAEQAKQEV